MKNRALRLVMSTRKSSKCAFFFSNDLHKEDNYVLYVCVCVCVCVCIHKFWRDNNFSHSSPI